MRITTAFASTVDALISFTAWRITCSAMEIVYLGIDQRPRAVRQPRFALRTPSIHTNVAARAFDAACAAMGRIVGRIDEVAVA